MPISILPSFSSAILMGSGGGTRFCGRMRGLYSSLMLSLPEFLARPARRPRRLHVPDLLLQASLVPDDCSDGRPEHKGNLLHLVKLHALHASLDLRDGRARQSRRRREGGLRHATAPAQVADALPDDEVDGV